MPPRRAPRAAPRVPRRAAAPRAALLLLLLCFALCVGAAAATPTPQHRTPTYTTCAGIEEALSPAGYLAAELREARAAVAALDRYALRLSSFEDSGLELVEQAHLAMSRLEQAAAAQAAPELILLACEVKVAAQRGAHLLRAYGQFHLLGRLVAWTRRARVEAKFRQVTERLRGLMPQAAGGADAAAAAAGAPGALRVGTGTLDRVSAGMAGTAGAGGGSGNGSGSGASMAASAGAAYAGQLLRKGRHHERVHSVAFAPPAAALAGNGSIGGGGGGGGGSGSGGDGGAAAAAAAVAVWWALDAAVEFYSDAAQATTSFATDGAASLTCVAVDGAGNTWGGTSGGGLLARRPYVWDAQAEERLFAGPVRALAFDAGAAVVWAGDEHGCLRAARLCEDAWRIEPLAVALPGRAPRRGISTGALLGGVGRGSLLRRTASTKADRGAAAPCLEGPVRAILARDGRVWAAGGRSEPWLALFDAATGGFWGGAEMRSCGRGEWLGCGSSAVFQDGRQWRTLPVVRGVCFLLSIPHPPFLLIGAPNEIFQANTSTLGTAAATAPAARCWRLSGRRASRTP